MTLLVKKKIFEHFIVRDIQVLIKKILKKSFLLLSAHY